MKISRPSLYEYENDRRPIPTKVLEAAAAIFELPIEYFLGQVGIPTAGPKPDKILNRKLIERTAQRVREATSDLPPSPRTFATEAERISYALGVLDMAGTSNRLVIETSNEVSRAISAASAALIAPISGPLSAAPGPTVEELLDIDAAVKTSGSAAPVKPAVKRRRETGR